MRRHTCIGLPISHIDDVDICIILMSRHTSFPTQIYTVLMIFFIYCEMLRNLLCRRILLRYLMDLLLILNSNDGHYLRRWLVIDGKAQVSIIFSRAILLPFSRPRGPSMSCICRLLLKFLCGKIIELAILGCNSNKLPKHGLFTSERRQGW